MLITMKNAVRTYDGFQLNCTLELQPGRVTGLIGRNGSGKTTAMGAILGLYRPEQGEVRTLGKDPVTLTPADRRRIGVTLSEGGYSEYLRPTDVASVRAALYSDTDKSAFLKRVRENGLPVDKPIKEYSNGMKAKFNLLCAMDHDPDLLILDEPTAGLDVVARDEILDLLRDFMAEREGRGILITSHIATDLESLCDDLYFIHDGQVLLHADTDRILGEYAILKMTEDEYARLDKRHILYVQKEAYGFSALTDHKPFYADHAPEVRLDNGSIDGVMTMMLKGEKI